MVYKKKDLCRCCKQKELLLYLNLGRQPLANSYHKTNDLYTIPLEVMLCTNCYHSQLSVVVNPNEMFLNYLYLSGTSNTFNVHTKKLAVDAVSRIADKQIKVLDIACNDGTQLEYFRKLGCDVLGVDPAENLRSITEKKNINVVVDYWSEEVANKLKSKFNIITGTNVFAHVDNLDEFLNASKIVLAEHGYIILEFPYAENMITNNEFDTVYHEHLSYFLVNSFKMLVERHKLRIVDILRTQIHGGSIRFFLQSGSGQHSDKVTQLISEEKMKGLLNIQSYKKFSNRIAKNKTDMRKLLKDLRNKKKKIIGYAASAKGNTMLNYFKIDLDYIIDDNKLKWGYLTPGRNIPIYKPETIKEENDELNIVILAWNFYNEISKKILNIRGDRKDMAIIYVPEVNTRLIKKNDDYMHSA